MISETDICEICGQNLITINSKSEKTILNCYYCENQFDVLITCPNGHYICDACHSHKANDIILDYCLSTTEVNPFKMANLLLTHPKFKMYGPEHHSLVPLVLITMIKNLNLANPKGIKITKYNIKKALKRSEKIPGGFCGFYGTCGAAIGAGVAISIFLRATPSTTSERTFANKTVSKSLHRIADDLEHCCKRSVKIAIQEGIDMINSITGESIIFEPEKCQFSALNSRCEGKKCLFF